MSDARWERIKSIFNDAMALPAPQRHAFIESQCAGDAELSKEVRSLMESARPTRDQGALRTGGAAQAVSDLGTTTLEKVALKERPGTTVGLYKLLQPIGEGGFGMVFLAEQTVPVRRRVALKVIKLGMDTKAVVARFEAERQALALMDHPHIARVLDGGATEHGRPYFVMEYVVGDPITKFADERKLTVSDRLSLFSQVCSAVQHAHTKGVIHRDIKPANVLVSVVDGKPFAKVIDFGIAKATASPLTDKTLFTEHKQLIGTPEYMSPEQAEGSNDIDTRTDVYALGVLLYELLTGATPFEGTRLRSAAWGEMQRIIREEDPPMPSVRLNRDQAKLNSTAAARAEEPARLSTLLKGELDWIVMKALDKDRGRRYESPNQLAADVQRHLAGEAVVAAPVSNAYRLRKFVRRNKGPVLAGSAVAVALVAGMAVATWQWQRADTFNVEADRQATLAGYNAAKAELARDAAEWNAYRANIALTQTSIAVDNWADARRSLLEAPKEKRGWEWQLLQRQTEETIFARSNWQGGLFSPDGAWVVPNDSFGQVVVSTDTCEEQRLSAVGSEMCWSPDSRAFVVWTGNSAGVWTLREGTWRRSGTISANARHSDRRSSAFVGTRWYAACTEDGNIHVWDMENLLAGKPLSSINVRPGGGYVDIKASHLGVFVVRAISDDRLRYELQIWKVTDAATLERVDTLEDSEDTVLIDMTKDGRHVLAAKRGTGFVWSKSADDRYELAATLANLDISKGCYIDPAGNYVVAGNGDPRRLSRWNLRQSGTIVPECLDTGMRFGPVVAVAFDGAGHQVIVGGYESACRFEWPSLAMIDRWGGSRTMEHTYIAGAMNEWPETHAEGNRLLFTAGLHWMSSTGSAWLGSPDIGRGSEFTINKGPNGALWLAAILASAPKGQSGLHINTPDGSRFISGGSDGSVRFSAPDIDGSGVSRELAVFRMSGPVTNLHITGDGTRLIIELADSSARVWDIRNPSERRKEVQAAWAERIAAGKYLDQLWATDKPDDALRDAVVNDTGLSPLSLLVTADMLDERIEDDLHAARQAMVSITRSQTVNATGLETANSTDIAEYVKSRVVAAAEASTLPPRQKRQLVKMAAEWKYEKPTPDQLAELTNQRDAALKQRDVNLADLIIQRQTQPSENPGYTFPSLEELRHAVKTYQDVLGPASRKSVDAQVVLADVLESRGIDRVEAGRIFDDVIRIREGLVKEPDHELLSMWANRAAIAAKCAEFERAEVLYANLADHTVSVYVAQPNGHMWIRSAIHGHDGNSQIESKASAESVAAFFRTLKGRELKDVTAHVLFRDAANQVNFGTAWYPWALDSAQRALAIQPQHPGALAVLAELRARMSKDDFDATLRTAMDAIDSKPQSITKGKVLSREECAVAARELIARAKDRLNEPQSQRWRNDQDVAAAISKVETLLNPELHDKR